MVTGHAKIMGSFEVISATGEPPDKFEMALVIVFDNVEGFRAAIKSEQCQFTIGE